MTGLVENQVAIITGAARGIGAATARLFADQGAKVVVHDRDEAPARAVAADIRAGGGDAIAVAGDITLPEVPEHIVAESVAKYGSINILVNNAGYTWDGMLHKMSDAQWKAMLDVHNTAPFRMIRAIAPYMREAAKEESAHDKQHSPRCIVNVSSTSGLHGNIGQANYATAKLGIVGLTKTVAKEWGPFGIRCNAVAFGYIDTRLTQAKESGDHIEVDGQEVPLGIPGHLRDMMTHLIPLGRAGTPEEAAGAILLLASPLAAYITGHTLEATGGFGI